MTVLTIIGAVITALLPLLVKWLEREVEKDPQDTVFEVMRRNRRTSDELAEAIDGDHDIDVSVVWDRHDQLLFERGILDGSEFYDGNRGLGDLPESGWYVRSLGAVDAAPSTLRAGSAREFRTVQVRPGLSIPVFD